tara:strand:+ start:179 stop:529 length:351 start_codon:yes stop_codon:yes gene_type:complete
MSTRSHIGTIDTDGNISAVYCHFDGYPENMVPAIEGYIVEHGMHAFIIRIKEAQRGSGFRYFDTNGGETYGEWRDEWVDRTVTDIKECDQNFAYFVSPITECIVKILTYGKERIHD